MKSHLPLLACLSLLAFAPSGRAAEPKPPAELITTTPPSRPVPPLSINVDFPGGSISKLLTAISKADGVSFNIIGADDAADFARVELPAFSLRNVQLLTVVEVLQNLLHPRGFRLNGIIAGNPNSFVCVLTRTEAATTVKTTSPARLSSYQLAPYLSEQSVDDIVGAIRTAWELDPAHDRDALRLKFHAPTSVLLISGPGEAMQVARDVIDELRHTPFKKAAQPATQTLEPGNK